MQNMPTDQENSLPIQPSRDNSEMLKNFSEASKAMVQNPISATQSPVNTAQPAAMQGNPADATASFKKATWLGNAPTSVSGFGDSLFQTLQKSMSYALWFACFAISAIAVYFVIYPGYYDYYSLKSELITANQDYDKVSAHLAFLNKLKSLGTELDLNIKIAKDAVPIEEQIPYFLDQSIQMAKEAGLDVQTVNFGGLSVSNNGEEEDKSSNKLKSIPIRIAINGRYDDVIKFASLYENARRLVSPRTLSIRILDDVKQLEEYNEKIKSGELVSSNPDGFASGDTPTPTPTPSGGDLSAVTYAGTTGLYNAEFVISGFMMKEINAENVNIEEIVNSNPHADQTLKMLKDFKYYDPSPVPFEEANKALENNKTDTNRNPFSVTVTPSPTPTPAQ
ncbi:MAG: hypothetical protein E6Q58_00750 [Niabella sp.]|nr:MAG: hypothetical protein E6Q58_00750 [Niabella sp.]